MQGRASERLSKLGTETAYAIAAEAKEEIDKGNKVYSFHIGDLNFPTCKIIADAAVQAIRDGKTGYCAAAGVKELRDALSKAVGEERGVSYTAENVSIQSGGKPVITKFLQVISSPGDEVLYPSPGYPIYESQIGYLDCVKKPYNFIETEAGFSIDMEALKKQITPKTKIFIYNNHSNPVSAHSTDEEMKQIAELCIKHDLLVLSDEAYFGLVYDGTPKSIVALPGMQERTVILFTYSKSYSMTGWRLGAAIGPKWIVDAITKINTNDEACTTHFIQWAGIEAFTEEGQKYTADLRKSLKERRDILVKGINQVPGFNCTSPTCTFYLFVNVTEAMKNVGISNYEEFRKLLLKDTGVSVCTREHFGKSLPGETEKYIRFAYSGISCDKIQEACKALKDYFSNIPKSS
eukprot:TRINITY_DN14809_c0_g1_i1.p1 TRINITY_DN14809_c0_g1~~TRINITY_DN14809_c0_g1_i1.p1  ORF type:complete len:406 (-),score=78.38 TRINITY_DN14809_c0_g1_i1:84-1301(-)